MKRLRIVSALGALVLLVVPAARAGDFGIVAGGTYADQDIDGSDNIVAPLVGLQAGVGMGERSRWAFDGTWSPLDVDGGNDWNLMTLRTGPEFFFSDTLFFAPAVGWMWLDEEKGENASRGLASLGLGQRFAGPGNKGFSWQVRATQGLGSSGLNGNSVTNFEALLGYAWGRGGAPFTTKMGCSFFRRISLQRGPRNWVTTWWISRKPAATTFWRKESKPWLKKVPRPLSPPPHSTFSSTSTKTRSISIPTLTTPSESRACCLPRCRIYW